MHKKTPTATARVRLPDQCGGCGMIIVGETNKRDWCTICWPGTYNGASQAKKTQEAPRWVQTVQAVEAERAGRTTAQGEA